MLAHARDFLVANGPTGLPSLSSKSRSPLPSRRPRRPRSSRRLSDQRDGSPSGGAFLAVRVGLREAQQHFVSAASAGQIVQVHVPGGMAFQDVNRSPLLLATSRLGPQKEAATRQLLLDLPRRGGGRRGASARGRGAPAAAAAGRSGDNDGRQLRRPRATTAPIANKAAKVGEASRERGLAFGELVPVDPSTQRDPRLVLELPDILDGVPELLSAALQLRISLICARSKPASSSSSIAATRSS